MIQYSKILILILLVIGCSEQITRTTTSPPVVVEEEEKIFLEDGTGKKWDITHAVNHYGFKPELFDGGGGPYAIEPIIDPQMLTPDDAGYPQYFDEQLVIGYKSGEDVRAYSLQTMSRVEIANDFVDSGFVAVAY